MLLAVSNVGRLNTAKEAVIAAMQGFGDHTDPRWTRLANMAADLRDMERDAAAVQREHEGDE